MHARRPVRKGGTSPYGFLSELPSESSDDYRDFPEDQLKNPIYLNHLDVNLTELRQRGIFGSL